MTTKHILLDPKHLENVNDALISWYQALLSEMLMGSMATLLNIHQFQSFRYKKTEGDWGGGGGGGGVGRLPRLIIVTCYHCDGKYSFSEQIMPFIILSYISIYNHCFATISTTSSSIKLLLYCLPQLRSSSTASHNFPGFVAANSTIRPSKHN